MLSDQDEVFLNASRYAKSRNRRILRQDSPGHGMEGWVWKTSVPSAIKAFYRLDSFETELACYQRLLDHSVNQIHGLNVPVLEDFDASCRVIEITFVQPPYVLDFGKATLDHPPDYFREDASRFRSQWKQEFGERWPEVNALLHTLIAKYGIYYLDPREPNIRFDISDDDDSEDWLKEPPIDYSEYE